MQRHLLVGALLLFGAAACADLDVVNPNDPDAGRALRTAGDVESLIAGSYNTYFNGTYSFSGPGMFLSNASFQHNAPWANFAMEQNARIPRIPLVNDPAGGVAYSAFAFPWFRYYRALAALADGLRSLEDPDIAEEIGAEDVLRARAYGRFVQGMAHAGLAVLYDRAFVVDETVDLTQAQEPVDYNALMDAAFGYFNEAITLSGQGSFTIPTTWLADDVTSDELARIAHSQMARFRAAVARTPQERQAVNWASVISDVGAGITSDWIQDQDPDIGWYNQVVTYSTFPGWTQVSYFVYGMADQAGNYQRWLDLPILDKSPTLPDGTPALIITPDLRFPQGSTVAEQEDNPGTLLQIPGWGIAGVWARPDRGTWRWSYYWPANANQEAYIQFDGSYDYPEISVAEMRLLEAEANYWMGNHAEAANLVNVTRTAAGLNATDAAGTNTSCVPKLPDGTCGDLLEMLKWEKRMEVNRVGLFGAPWFFDSRGWGDLYAGTYLQFPIPCAELQVLEMLPCYTFGAGNEFASPGSSYNYPHEG
ncbi:MAG: RagB/SusD family nutrient uptake outer membrane protein [Longimicrobiales bacterium]